MRRIECYGRIAAVLVAWSAAAQTGVLTYHNDNARTGQYLSEVLLSPAAVSKGKFGKREFLAVDGAVYAQPLYMPRVKIAGQGFHDVLFVATSHDSVYAFDADAAPGSPPLWQTSFLTASPSVRTVTSSEVDCSVMPELGISGTPVIDAASGTMYVIAYTQGAGNQYMYRLHALDVTSGAERPGSPVEIQPAGFVPLAHKQRTALLLANRMVYSSWSGNCDDGTYHGWLMAHDSVSLSMTGFFNSSPGDSGASFWSGGAGPTADQDGNIYLVSANGDFDGDFDASEYDESVLRFTVEPGVIPADRFTPFNKLQLDIGDLDLGSSGAVLLPDEAGDSTHPHVLFTSGKEGRMYLLDRDALGGVQAGTDSGALASLPVLGGKTFGSAAYFNGALYVAPANSALMEFPIAGAQLASTPAASSAIETGAHGATPSISANGSSGGIVWMVTDGGRLTAYDAGDLSELYDSDATAADQMEGYAEFSVPTIADGKVFAGDDSGVDVYGEIASGAPRIAAVTNAASYSTSAISPGSLISIFGTDLAAKTTNASAVPLPVSLADTSVTIDGVPAPVLFESPGQINVQVPWEVPAGTASVLVRERGAVSGAAKIAVQPAAPGLFQEADGFAAAVNGDGSVNSVSKPAAAGSVISVFFTGLGPVSGAVDDGAAPGGQPALTASMAASATLGGMPAQVEFAGLSPQYPGLAQMNLKVPAVAGGVYSLTVSIGGKSSNAAQVAVSGD